MTFNTKIEAISAHLVNLKDCFILEELQEKFLEGNEKEGFVLKQEVRLRMQERKDWEEDLKRAIEKAEAQAFGDTEKDKDDRAVDGIYEFKRNLLKELGLDGDKK